MNATVGRARGTSGLLRRGFSLIELLVVVLIIVLLIGILVPTLNGVRNAARRAATTSLITSLKTAVSTFETDERRLPGVFTARQMGAASNRQRGFTAMENILLDLTGGVVDTGTPLGGQIIDVGPGTGAANSVRVNLDFIGAATRKIDGVEAKLYFTPPAERYVTPDDLAGNTDQSGRPEHKRLPDLVDTFGTPLLAWVQDDNPNPNEQFALPDASTAARPFFFWAANAGHLGATGTGPDGVNQARESLIGASYAGAPGESGIESLAGILGSRAFPRANAAPAAPAAAKGAMVIHSAGQNGVFVGENEQGAKRSPDRVVRYSVEQDPMDGFDDIVLDASQ